MSSAFKALPGHEKLYTPHSEYLFKFFQPKFDDLLFLGGDYESFFDRFEILLSLEHAHLNEKNRGGFWGPIGRFGWKHHRGYGSPFTDFISEANEAGEAWLPLAASFFDGTFERFDVVSKAMSDRLSRLGWF